MRIPKIENYNNTSSITYYSLKDIQKPTLSFSIMSDKDKIKLIKEIDRIVRGSVEYKQYIQFLKTEIDMMSCSFFQNVNNVGRNKIRIEIHHEPFTLFDITNIVLEKYITEDLPLNPLVISEEIMYIHYRNMVGLIPLSKTAHTLVHDGKLFIPLNNVFGGFANFVAVYESYIPEDLLNLLKTKIKMTKDIINPDNTILETKYTYITVDGFELPQYIEFS